MGPKCNQLGQPFQLHCETSPDTYDPPKNRALEWSWVAIGRRTDRDDVLFQFLDADGCAVVHLTWARHPELPPWPDTKEYERFSAWQATAMARDHAN